MTSFNLLLVTLGIFTLDVAWLPSLSAEFPLSYPTLFVTGGWLFYQLPMPLPDPLPQHQPVLATHLTELCSMVALTARAPLLPG